MFRRAPALAALALCLVLPQQALAATNFYASAGGTGSCLSAQSPCSLPTAANNAGQTPGGANVIVVGALTHTAALTLPPNPGTNPVHLIGSGSGAGGTFVDFTTSGAALTLDKGSTAENLRVRGKDPGVVVHYGSALTGAAVESTGASSFAVSSQFSSSPGEALIDRSTLSAPANGIALSAGNGGAGHTLVVRDSTLTAGTGLNSIINIDSVIAQRDTFEASKIGVQIGGADGFVSDSVIRMSGAASKGVDLTTLGGPGNPLALIHDTIDGAGTTGASTGVAVANAPSAPPNTATVRNSIVRGFATDLKPSGASGRISATRTDFGGGPAGSPGVFDGGGNLDVDPAWVDRAAGDYRLQSGSPLIDAAGSDPIDAPAHESPTDRAGNERILDGNGDGSAQRDMGALEFLYVPPAAPGPGPGPTTAPPPAPALVLTPFALSGRTLTVSGNSVKVPVACDASAPVPCQVAVLIHSTKPLAPRAAARKPRKILTFGKGRASIAPGKKGSVKVKLSRKARSLLRAHKLSKVSVTASIVPGTATAPSTTKVYKVKRAKKRRR